MLFMPVLAYATWLVRTLICDCGFVLDRMMNWFSSHSSSFPKHPGIPWYFAAFL